MSRMRDINQWKEYIESCLDFRSEEGIYRIARDMFTEPELFDLEMELIFEKNWIYACHESEILNKHDFLTMQAGRQPLIITRDGEGKLNALINACQHRGTTLTRVGKGNQSTFTCPFHAWCYKSDGRLVKVKAPAEYGEDFDKATRGLQKARIESYKGFVFVSLDVNGTDSLEDYLGDAKVFFDMMVAQSPTGELEVLPGKSAYTYDGNWKLQNENGLDGYHVSTVHYNYVSTVQHRQQVNASKGHNAGEFLDYSKLGAGDAETDDGWFAFNNGHSVLFSDMPNPEVRPGYATIMPRLVKEYGQDKAEWMMHRLRNLNVYPSMFFLDQISSQLRIIRPIAWNKTEINSFCLGVKGESDADRENRIRQFEDFFNVSGMGTPDDLVEFREAQRGFQARLERWSDISRGRDKWTTGPTKNTDTIGISPAMIGAEFTHEGLYVNQHGNWQKFLLNGLARKAADAQALKLKEV
ncbi:anthranilate 1,2-dioxygenase (deaminating, decarboxylating) large subunit [Pseudomonas marginalis]|jgi:anthranilate 1,2-dioxygenase (deaminating, decarboxylating) large subunit|uniref:anthranilate 1,2-dioxygenase large subunit n=1 Tax=Pseudomonas TaxID=286 RepID=UPI000C6D8FCE|nr:MULTISPECIES: anthranilate 1,2-dioxygenase large subunit [Pseudomonas]AUG07835.1 anthranilate 1,2-dioxygenase large subunit [Pseudomonas sp. S09G 359]MCP1507720.1 anthranilate 1,2-dioxygenase (deaminating, decarboxylating) large subunit [Pseudomonas marginalis]MCP1525224.1 anthranilate 1,2-dioxygenase (deaminating, decarboxylating) large subunit [Pseudomonas marginalis]MDQ0500181.1 anthranilate 1,2-dioxygenase (deaminating, decarboxylating) large subunit [Pseudomonas marginalis]